MTHAERTRAAVAPAGANLMSPTGADQRQARALSRRSWTTTPNRTIPTELPSLSVTAPPGRMRALSVSTSAVPTCTSADGIRRRSSSRAHTPDEPRCPQSDGRFRGAMAQEADQMPSAQIILHADKDITLVGRVRAIAAGHRVPSSAPDLRATTRPSLGRDQQVRIGRVHTYRRRTGKGGAVRDDGDQVWEPGPGETAPATSPDPQTPPGARTSTESPPSGRKGSWYIGITVTRLVVVARYIANTNRTRRPAPCLGRQARPTFAGITPRTDHRTAPPRPGVRRPESWHTAPSALGCLNHTECVVGRVTTGQPDTPLNHRATLTAGRADVANTPEVVLGLESQPRFGVTR